MRKICIVTRGLGAGGAERVISYIANYLCSIGIEVIILPIFSDNVFYEFNERVKFHSFAKFSSKLRKYFEVRKKIIKDCPDLVLALPEEIGIYLTLVLLLTKIPVITSERNDPNIFPQKNITRFLRHISYFFVDGIVFQTKTAQSYFSQRIQNKSVVIPNPIDLKMLPDIDEDRKDNIIVSAGRLEEQKNFTMLIEAFGKFQLKYPNYQLLIYGEGSQRKFLEEKAKNKINNISKFSMPGTVKNLPEAIKKAKIFALTSDYEGMPNVLIEAMAMGLVVVSTKCPSGGPEELITDGVSGFLVETNDVQALYAVFCKIAEDSFCEDIMKLEALKSSKKYDMDHILKTWLEYIKNVVEDKKVNKCT